MGSWGYAYFAVEEHVVGSGEGLFSEAVAGIELTSMMLVQRLTSGTDATCSCLAFSPILWVSSRAGVDKFLARWRKRRIVLCIELPCWCRECKNLSNFEDFPNLARSFAYVLLFLIEIEIANSLLLPGSVSNQLGNDGRSWSAQHGRPKHFQKPPEYNR